MLFTAPSFLFLFLPAMMAIYALIPQHYRRYAILLFNLAYYVIAVWHQPESLLLALLTAAFTYSAGFVIAVTHRRSTLLAAIAVDLAAFVIYRIAADLPLISRYPLGASIYLLASISYLIDIYRNDAPHAKNIADLLIYMFFFPTLMVGPVLRYKDFGTMLDQIEFSLSNMAEGIKLYLAGFFQYVSVASVLAYMLEKPEAAACADSFPVLVLLMLMTAAQIWFALSGYSNMARGLMYMLGIPHPADFSLFRLVRSPIEATHRIFASLNRWVEDYLVYPILRLSFLSPRLRRLLSACVICFVPALWLRSRLFILLPLLPILLWRCLLILRDSGHRREIGDRWRAVGRVFYLVLFFLLSILALFLAAAGSPADGFGYFRAAFDSADMSIPYGIYAVLAQSAYLVVGIAGFLFLLLLTPAAEQKIARLPRPIGIILRSAALIAVMGCFIFTILHVLPQFPQYASSVFAHPTF
ncbi:MAG: hypothetical protein IJC15_07815 [Clostridia bacterium]|nr:hypothetical protein [Clostridia bacterium]